MQVHHIIQRIQIKQQLQYITNKISGEIGRMRYKKRLIGFIGFAILGCAFMVMCRKCDDSEKKWWKDYLNIDMDYCLYGDKIQKNVIAIIDSGIDISCDDIIDSVYINQYEIPGNGIDDDENGYIDDVNGWNFYDDSNEIYTTFTADYHGTMIAGILSGTKYGISPNIKFMPLKCFRGSEGSIEDVVEAIDYAYNMGVRIFNCSWDTAQYNEKLYLKMSEYSDAIFVCASGKNQENLNTTNVYPACYDLENIICVGACDYNEDIYEYSGFGKIVDIYVPGENIYCLMPEKTYNYAEGTSLSVAMVSGICAIKKAINPDISIKEIKSSFYATEDDDFVTKIKWEG